MDDGTWNFGNTFVFGSLYPGQPTATGLGLLSLSLTTDGPTQLHRKSFEYLEALLPTTRAAASLCWGILGLRAWNRRPDASETWLGESYERSRQRSNPVLQIAFLVLASGERALPVLGVSRFGDGGSGSTTE